LTVQRCETVEIIDGLGRQDIDKVQLPERRRQSRRNKLFARERD
jgi:hypothetical protein